MASLADLAQVHSRLDEGEINQLQRLVASWGLLADLCFADLLLFAEVDAEPLARREPGQPLADSASLVVLGQMRPLTNQTLYRSDWVGNVVPADRRPLVARSLALGEIIDGEVTSQALKERVRGAVHPGSLEGSHDRGGQPRVGSVRSATRASSNAPTSRCSTASPA